MAFELAMKSFLLKARMDGNWCPRLTNFYKQKGMKKQQKVISMRVNLSLLHQNKIEFDIMH